MRGKRNATFTNTNLKTNTILKPCTNLKTPAVDLTQSGKASESQRQRERASERAGSVHSLTRTHGEEVALGAHKERSKDLDTTQCFIDSKGPVLAASVSQRYLSGISEPCRVRAKYSLPRHLSPSRFIVPGTDVMM